MGRCSGGVRLPSRARQEPHLQDVGRGDVHGLRPSIVQVLHHELQQEEAPGERQRSCSAQASPAPRPPQPLAMCV